MEQNKIIMNKAYYVDTFSFKNQHEVFNASSILMFSNIFNHIEYRAHRSSKNNVENLLGSLPKNVNYSSIHFCSTSNKFKLFYRQIIAVLYNCYYVIKAKSNEFVIINYNTMIAIYPINFFCKILNKKVIIICHGEMYDLCFERKTSYIFKKSKLFFTKKDYGIAHGLHFIVLGEFIKKNLFGKVSDAIIKKIFSIDHSSIFSPKSSFNNINKNRKMLKIGIIGSLRKTKGSENIFNFIKHVQNNNNKIEFVLIGNFDYEKPFLLKKGFTIPENLNGSFINRSYMRELISNLDYVLFLLPPDIYKFTSSGSFFDALDSEIPILSLKNDFIDYYYQTYGKFGHLFDTTNEIADFIINHNYLSEDMDIKSIKLKLNPLNLSTKLFDSISKL